MKRKKLKPTRLDRFLPREHVEYFRNLHVESKKVGRKKVQEL
jgi:hypothetical protein